MDKVLALLTKDARMSAAEIAQRLNMEENEVAAIIAAHEESGSILGYRALLDPEKCKDVPVRALIEVRVMPYKGHGFERVARHIAQFPEVRSISLMSGGFDLCAEVEGVSMHEVALFVAEKLAVIDGVMGTATHFVLRRYKYEGIHCGQEEKDKRGFTL
jgi:DNA-binding Lrp family transcriptional regulator